MKKNRKEETNVKAIKLTRRQKKKLQSQFPKGKMTKEEIELRREKMKVRLEDICLMLVTIFYLSMLIGLIYALYLMWTYQW